MSDTQLVHHVLSTHLSDINEHVNRINSGGCGHSALAMYNALILHDVHCSIVLVGDEYIRNGVKRLIKYTGTDNINDAYFELFNDLDEADSPAHSTLNDHVALLFDGKLYDSDGFHANDHRAASEHLTVATMELFLANIPSWNRTFNYANEDNVNPVSKLKSFYLELFEKHLGGQHDTYASEVGARS